MPLRAHPPRSSTTADRVSVIGDMKLERGGPRVFGMFYAASTEQGIIGPSDVGLDSSLRTIR